VKEAKSFVHAQSKNRELDGPKAYKDHFHHGIFLQNI
jgi:hypothetical protein